MSMQLKLVPALKNACLRTEEKSLKEIVIAAILFASPWAAYAQECNYADAGGVEIEFTGQRSADGRLSVARYKDMNGPFDPEELAGKRARVLRPATGMDRTTFELVTESCETIWMRDNDGVLKRSDGERTGFKVTGELPSIWSYDSKVDPMTDRKSCSVWGEGDLGVVLLWDSAGFSLGAASADFPGRPVSFRIDSNAALSGSDRWLTGQTARSALRQIRGGGKTLLAAGYKWPYDHRVLSEYSLDGILTEIAACEAYMGVRAAP